VPAKLASLRARDQKRIFSDALSFARAFQPIPSHSRFDVSAFCKEGELRLIFVVDADSESADGWSELIRQFNINAAVGSLPIDRSVAGLAT
jgi:hypothetical protein